MPGRNRLVLLLLLASPLPAMAGSVCFGTPSDGRLQEGVRLPASGPNFGPYSTLGVGMGRTYVHSRVARVVQQSYATLAATMPDRHFVYGESGWAGGGRIRPHRTHQNGLAVDFMVPVKDAIGRSVPLPSNAANKFGYGIEFDGQGRHGEYRIDFEAMAEHLHALRQAADREGIRISRVIFDPDLLPLLQRSRRGALLRKQLHFMPGRAWIRHDEHYHVDFAVACRPLPG